MILAGRRLNDNMGIYVADQVVKLMTKKQIQVVNSNILVMGFTFKENCTDLRNTRVIDLIKELERFNCNVDIYDPWVKKEDAKESFNISIIDELKQSHYDAIILAVSHNIFLEIKSEMYRDLGKDKFVLYDIKYLLKADEVDGRL